MNLTTDMLIKFFRGKKIHIMDDAPYFKRETVDLTDGQTIIKSRVLGVIKCKIEGEIKINLFNALKYALLADIGIFEFLKKKHRIIAKNNGFSSVDELFDLPKGEWNIVFLEKL